MIRALRTVVVTNSKEQQISFYFEQLHPDLKRYDNILDKSIARRETSFYVEDATAHFQSPSFAEALYIRETVPSTAKRHVQK